MAKGRILGAQFLELFKDDLFMDLAKHANSMAQKLTRGLKSHGIPFLSEPEPNQIFPILPAEVVTELHRSYGFYDWEYRRETGQTCIRLVTSWAT